MSLLLNLGSGQRPFAPPWINVDCQPKWLGGNKDVKWPEGSIFQLADIRSMPEFQDNSAGMIVLYHVLEHFGCGDADGVVKECRRILQPGGKLLIVCPNVEALAVNYLRSKGWILAPGNPNLANFRNWPPIDEWIFVINLCGAYMGDEADRHKWLYSQEGLIQYVNKFGPWSSIGEWDKVRPEGTDISWDWYFATCMAVK